MKRAIAIFLALCVLCLTTGASWHTVLTGIVSNVAASLQETLGTSAANVTYAEASADAWVASKHTAAASYTLTILKVNMLRAGAGDAAVLTGRIWSDSGGSPGTLLASSTNTQQLPAGATEAFVDFNFAGLSITTSTDYWFGLSAATTSGVNYYRIRAGAASTGTTQQSADGSTWSALGTRKFNMELWGN